MSVSYAAIRGEQMRASMLRLYAPFIAIASVQALFIAVAPSTPKSNEVAAFDDSTTGPGAFEGGAGGGGAAGGGGSGGGGAAGAGAGGGGGGSSVVTTPGGGSGFVPPGTKPDLSHCKGPYQFDLLHSNPYCVPKWPEGADNGGATFRGVSADTVRVVFFTSQANPTVNQILATQGLARTDNDMHQLVAAATKFINEHYELYGRKIEIIYLNNDDSPCPQTPPNVDACIQHARNVVKQYAPFMLLWDSSLYPAVFDEFARLGVVTIGGWHFSAEYFTKRRPYRYDVFMDGSRTAENIADFYCKNMAGKNADHTGRIIHTEIGARGQVRRRVGISVPEVDADVRAAEYLVSLLKKCDPGAKPPVLQKYISNIETAQQQSNATVAKNIDEGVTTTICMCDPITPLFGTQANTRNRYYPEIVVPGMGLIDYDKLGRLYDPAQMAHAFGPSHIQVQPRHEDSDASRMWRAAGRSGTPFAASNLPWAYMALAASMIQGTGPNLTPLTLERAVLSSRVNGGWELSGHDPAVPLVKFGPGDYTALSDAKVVRWSETAASSIDGQPRSYVNLQGGRRWEVGHYPSDLLSQIPVAAQ